MHLRIHSSYLQDCCSLKLGAHSTCHLPMPPQVIGCALKRTSLDSCKGKASCFILCDHHVPPSLSHSFYLMVLQPSYRKTLLLNQYPSICQYSCYSLQFLLDIILVSRQWVNTAAEMVGVVSLTVVWVLLVLSRYQGHKATKKGHSVQKKQLISMTFISHQFLLALFQGGNGG